MKKVVAIGTTLVVVIYLIVAIFGYVNWADTAQENIILTRMNILEVDYKGCKLFLVGSLMIYISVALASPLCVIPAKHSI